MLLTRFKYVAFLFIFAYFHGCMEPATAQSTTVSVTVTDLNGQVWKNGTLSYVFQPNPSFSGTYQWNGSALPTQYLTPHIITLSSSGTGSWTIPTSTLITPAGSSWRYVVCPNASSACTVINIASVGATQNISSQITAATPEISIQAGSMPLAYSDAEITTTPNQGGIYFNVTSFLPKYFDGANWQFYGGGGGGGVTFINGVSGSFTFSGPGVSCSSTTCTFSGGSSFPYPGAGIPNSTSSAWGTSFTINGTALGFLDAVQVWTATNTFSSVIEANGGITDGTCIMKAGGVAGDIAGCISIASVTFTAGNVALNTNGINVGTGDFTFSNFANIFLGPSGSGTGNINVGTGYVFEIDGTFNLSALSGCLSANSSTHVVTGSGSACGSGGGSGTVTSVGLSLPSFLTVTVSPITTSGTLTATLTSQAANTVFGNFTSSSAAPTFSASPIFSAAGLTNIPACSTCVTSSTTAGGALVGTYPNPLLKNIGTGGSFDANYATVTNGDGTISPMDGRRFGADVAYFGWGPLQAYFQDFGLQNFQTIHDIINTTNGTCAGAMLRIIGYDVEKNVVALGSNAGTYVGTGCTDTQGNPVTAPLINSLKFGASATFLEASDQTVLYIGLENDDAGQINFGGDTTNKPMWTYGGVGHTSYRYVSPFMQALGGGLMWADPTTGQLTQATATNILGAIGNIPNANLATQTANTVLGALTATTPSGLAIPSCSGASNALTWTSGTGFGCNTISGGGTPAYPLTISSGVSGGIVYGSSATQLTVSAAGTAGQLVLWGGAGTAPTASGYASTDVARLSIGNQFTQPQTVNQSLSGADSTGWASFNSSTTVNSSSSFVCNTRNASFTTFNACKLSGKMTTATAGAEESTVTLSSWHAGAAVNSLILSGAGNATILGQVNAATFSTATNCASSASPAVCGSAASGAFTIVAATTSIVVNTSAVTANSEIEIQPDSSLGSRLGVTCNTTLASIVGPVVTARTAGTSFTVTITGTLVTNPACYSYSITN